MHQVNKKSPFPSQISSGPHTKLLPRGNPQVCLSISFQVALRAYYY